MTAFSGLLVLLGSNPEGDVVASVLVASVLSGLRAHAASIHARAHGEALLRVVGLAGYNERVAKFAQIPLDAELPPAECVRRAEVVTVRAEDRVRYPLLVPDEASLLADPPASGDLEVVAVPIVHRAVVTGALTMVTAARREWSWADATFLRGVGAALGMWLAERSGAPTDLSAPSSQAMSFSRARPVGLTERQSAVLRMMADNRSNPEIARELGYSVSTVKNEVAAVMSLLAARDRRDAVERAVRGGLLAHDAGGETGD